MTSGLPRVMAGIFPEWAYVSESQDTIPKGRALSSVNIDQPSSPSPYDPFVMSETVRSGKTALTSKQPPRAAT